MAKKAKIGAKNQVWIDVRKRYHLSHAHIQMARQLGLNPKKFGKIANHKQEPWKAPLPVFIEEIYFKRFGKRRPENVKSIEHAVKDQEKKKAERRKRKQLKKQGVVINDGEKAINSESGQVRQRNRGRSSTDKTGTEM
jgi:rhodanese-related sulfurtransferase